MVEFCRDIGDIYLSFEAEKETERMRKEINLKIKTWKRKETEFYRDLSDLKPLNEYFPEDYTLDKSRFRNPEDLLRHFRVVESNKILSIVSGISFRSRLILNHKKKSGDEIRKISFYPYFRGTLAGTFYFTVKNDKIFKSNLDPKLILLKSLFDKFYPLKVSELCSTILMQLKCYYSRKSQVEEFIREAQEGSLGGGLRAITADLNYTSVAFQFTTESTDDDSFAVSISLAYDLDDERPRQDSIVISPLHGIDLSEEDERDLLDQCQDLYKYPLAEAVKKAFNEDSDL